MDYLQNLKYHYRPQKGWINDPNGLVYFKGYYHVFYQHCPDYEVPGKQPMHWGHARTKDFLNWEELPLALYPDCDYDNGGCWSGTAIVKDGALYLFYASVYTPNNSKEEIQTVSVACSKDGINFEKYAGNPVIESYPKDGGPDFRDPAVCFIDGTYYCVMATGNPKDKAARLLLYKSQDLYKWEYLGIMSEWAECKFAECPSFMSAKDKFLLTASVCPLEQNHYFSVMYGSFSDGVFELEYSAEVDKGPDQYAGQVFTDHSGRNILISWVSGWEYNGFAEKDIGCMSIPRELKLRDGKITAYPIAEVQHLLKEQDPAVKRTDNGFVIERKGRSSVVYNGEVSDLKILRDGYVVEVFVNGGAEVYTALL
ncbi:MAG: glycoside hydrolase family 32 protein [Ruminococcaceae bacterium]|nr:glycoside hydrolase family 32 protein [Oscillospiraceae bacterium]